MKTPNLEVLRGLLVSVHKDCVARVNPEILRSRAYRRDRKYLASANLTELLVELPTIGKAFDRSLCKGEEKTFSYANCGLPHPVPENRFSYFLDGVARGEAECVRAFRQVHLLYAKLECESDPTDAINAFVDRQSSLPESLARTPCLRIARDLVGRILSNLNWEEIIPRHGPGATSTGEKPWEKFTFKRIYRDMQDYYPADRYFFLDWDHLSDRYDEDGLFSIATRKDGKQRKVRFTELDSSHCTLVAVPKDFRGPRIIAMEALEKQWIQQGQRRALVRRLEQHGLTRGYVNFTDQSVNRRLALESSSSEEFSTLDLKDASDRVSLALCSALIEPPSIDYLKASRSVAVKTPSGDLVQLRSFSPMGSGICFPLESLIFYALSLSAVHLARKPKTLFPSYKDWKRDLGLVYVYGDDLIVRSDFASEVIEQLESVGLVVNKDKCCCTGRFRESCGCDAYAGQDVTPVRIKHLPDRLLQSSYPSSVSYLNRFRHDRMMNSFDYLLEVFEKEFHTVPFLTCHDDPCGIFTTSFTEAVDWNNSHFRTRNNKRLQRVEWRVTEVSPVVRTLANDGWSQFLRVMTAFPYGIPSDWSMDDDEWSLPRALHYNQRWRTL